MKFDIINPLECQDWDKLVLSTSEYSFFHTSSWAMVLCESYQYTPFYFTLMDSEKRLVTLIPIMEINSKITGRRAVSLPFTDYCEPIITDRRRIKNIMDDLIQYGKKAGWKSLELRWGSNLSSGFPSSYCFYGHTLDLSGDFDRLSSTFRSSTRRNVKKALKEGVQVSIFNSIESLKEFYHLNCLTRRRHGLPPQPYYFFKSVFNQIISKNEGMVILASYRGKTIAGAVYFHFGKKVIYKYGASNNNFQHLRANNLVMWEAIKWYSINGYKTLSLGITQQENSGLRQFKNGWGTQEEIINYYKYDLGKNSFIQLKSNVKGFHNRIFRRLPIPLLKISGTLLYKHIG